MAPSLKLEPQRSPNLRKSLFLLGLYLAFGSVLASASSDSLLHLRPRAPDVPLPRGYDYSDVHRIYSRDDGSVNVVLLERDEPLENDSGPLEKRDGDDDYCYVEKPCDTEEAWIQDMTPEEQELLNFNDVFDRKRHALQMYSRALHSIQRRWEKTKQTKLISPCKKSVGEDMFVETEKYPGPTKLVEKFPNAEFYDFDNFQDCNNFGFGKRATPNGAQIKARKQEDQLDSEHILEGQLMTDIIDYVNDKTAKTFESHDPNTASVKTDLCTYMTPYWNKMPTTKAPQQLKSGLQLKENVKKNKQPMKYLVSIFPTTQEGYLDEFTLLHTRPNTLKGRIYGTGAVTDESDAKGMMQLLSKTKYKGKTDTRTSKGLVDLDLDWQRAIQRYKEGLATWTYMNEDKVLDILLKQFKRGGTMFADIEDTIVDIQWDMDFPNQNINKKTIEKWKKQDFKKHWKEFFDERDKAARKKLKDWLEKWAAEIAKVRERVSQDLKADDANLDWNKNNPKASKPKDVMWPGKRNLWEAQIKRADLLADAWAKAKTKNKWETKQWNY